MTVTALVSLLFPLLFYVSLQPSLAQYEMAGLPPIAPAPKGSDYAPPALWTDFLNTWRASSPRNVSVEYGTFKSFLESIDAAPGTSLPVIRGERPNLWWPETTPTHHWMYDNLRAAARLLPTAETFWTWEALLASSWSAYPEPLLEDAWLNISIQGVAQQFNASQVHLRFFHLLFFLRYFLALYSTS
jgi:hypothetical protein